MKTPESNPSETRQTRIQQITEELAAIPSETDLSTSAHRNSPYYEETVMGNEARKRKLEAELKELEDELLNDQIENH